MKPKIKICCIKSIQEAQTAYEAGADAIGLVANMPSGPGVIDDQLIATIAKAVPADLKTFLLTSEKTAEAIYNHHQKVGTTTIQIVDYLPISELSQLRKQMPDTELVQVIHIEDQHSIDLAHRYAPFVNALLLDSGNTKLAVKELGGTGRTHDWSISQRVVQEINLPVFLAGGIHSGNIGKAIEQVMPYGIDLCSGVRTEDHLDQEKLAALFNALT